MHASHFLFRLSSLSTAALLALTLSACGGGGDNGPSLEIIPKYLTLDGKPPQVIAQSCLYGMFVV